MIEDAIDFFEGLGIYHATSCDGHQHHVAGEKLTTNELCLRVKEILDQSTLLVYLDRRDDVVMRYFIVWFNQIQEDFPLFVWVDEDDNERQFFYERYSGAVERFYVGAGMQIPVESFESAQTALCVEKEKAMKHVAMGNCQMGSCENESAHTVRGGSGASIHVCEDHKSSITEQLSKVDGEKKRKSAIRREKRKIMGKKQKPKYVPMSK